MINSTQLKALESTYRHGAANTKPLLLLLDREASKIVFSDPAQQAKYSAPIVAAAQRIRAEEKRWADQMESARTVIAEYIDSLGDFA